MTLFWLSFVNPNKPVGEKFEGVVILEAEDGLAAVRRAWAMGLNPGGEALIAELMAPYPDTKYRNRLLTREEAEACNREMVH